MRSSLLDLPPLDPLRGFVAAARHLSFTRAADELCLTQSAVSRQVQTLEAALGEPLFVRGVRSLQLSAEGERLAAAAEGWLAEYGRLAEAMRRPGARPVTVTAAIGIAALWLVPRLRDFQRRHPEAEVRIDASNRMKDLAREDIDLALRYCADRDAPPEAIKLFGETVLPVGHPSIAAGLELNAETLPRLTLLEYDEPGFPWLGWEHWLAAIGLDGVRPRARIAFSHYDQLIHAASAGQGLAIGRAVLVDPLIEDGRLMPVGTRQMAVPGRGFWLVPAPGPQRPEVERFATWVVSSARTGKATEGM
ncbi:LysR substrate-binding domain-containing protein [Pseudothauera rhizosphaerae]|uniref:LysR family transcriptional regulator n=1 Tax=Pseudothauera rhizosphaerae TaxID=2565932 RepID=A0A4V3WB83_9RHOO|nr:LysR substrate-binding domain-containing protein [Pseudothauera rhizosphaerae]THF61996.1 LysR family transcriptional regulator [Pseudothauera rhizosphaerae]